MLISVYGRSIPDEVWAAADVVGAELELRPGSVSRVSAYFWGYKVADNIRWDSYSDLLNQLKDLKRNENTRIGAFRG